MENVMEEVTTAGVAAEGPAIELGNTFTVIIYAVIAIALTEALNYYFVYQTERYNKLKNNIERISKEMSGRMDAAQENSNSKKKKDDRDAELTKLSILKFHN